MIRPADKGGGIVLLNKSDYMDEMHRILGDRETYIELPKNPTLEYKKELKNLVAKGFDSCILTPLPKLKMTVLLRLVYLHLSNVESKILLKPFFLH